MAFEQVAVIRGRPRVSDDGAPPGRIGGHHEEVGPALGGAILGASCPGLACPLNKR
jgi:hypothetical protein